MPKILFLRVKGELHDRLKERAIDTKTTINAVAVQVLTAGAAAFPTGQGDALPDFTPHGSAISSPPPSEKRRKNRPAKTKPTTKSRRKR